SYLHTTGMHSPLRGAHSIHLLDLPSAPWHQVVLQGLVGQNPQFVQDYLQALWGLALQDHPEFGDAGSMNTKCDMIPQKHTQPTTSFTHIDVFYLQTFAT
ncbi:MAG: hypothetical protein MPL62_16490, partial [Alphaproteobacteria bacterium]|nr:hypothetical protein [Alphaproteobacteria bacterium]